MTLKSGKWAIATKIEKYVSNLVKTEFDLQKNPFEITSTIGTLDDAYETGTNSLDYYNIW